MSTAYGHGFGLGARTTLPALPFTAAAVSYDFYVVRIEGAFGMRLAPDDARNPSDFVAGFITVSFPVHRLGNADFSLAVGPGVTYEDPGPGAAGNGPDSKTSWLVLAGARIRTFTAQHFALIGTLGTGLQIESSGATTWVIGAQPFGAIGFYYYFR
jgi:hypothetical protein